MQKTAQDCLLCGQTGFHSFAAGCIYASPSVKQAQPNAELDKEIERLKQLFGEKKK